jgi:hypothetical protein
VLAFVPAAGFAGMTSRNQLNAGMTRNTGSRVRRAVQLEETSSQCLSSQLSACGMSLRHEPARDEPHANFRHLL